MALTNSYVQVYGQLPDFFAKLQQGQAPDHFTRQHLVDLGFASSNHRALIPLLKELGFLTPEGEPTPRYHSYRSKADGRRIMGDALREVYRDLFVLKEHPTDSDRALFEGKFKSAHNVSDRVAQLMTSTFFALLALADLSPAGDAKPPEPPPAQNAQAKSAANDGKPQGEEVDSTEKPDARRRAPTLHYNIQIHLRATKDVEVFNAIFKSLKEHLLD